ncbi:MAG: hypothetical protein J5379_08540 [Clostridiales bacterium]|nr:hypothetical protein [Clostridiales bacterium]
MKNAKDAKKLMTLSDYKNVQDIAVSSLEVLLDSMVTSDDEEELHGLIMDVVNLVTRKIGELLFGSEQDICVEEEDEFGYEEFDGDYEYDASRDEFDYDEIDGDYEYREIVDELDYDEIDGDYEYSGPMDDEDEEDLAEELTDGFAPDFREPFIIIDEREERDDNQDQNKIA